MMEVGAGWEEYMKYEQWKSAFGVGGACVSCEELKSLKFIVLWNIIHDAFVSRRKEKSKRNLQRNQTIDELTQVRIRERPEIEIKGSQWQIIMAKERQSEEKMEESPIYESEKSRLRFLLKQIRLIQHLYFNQYRIVITHLAVRT